MNAHINLTKAYCLMRQDFSKTETFFLMSQSGFKFNRRKESNAGRDTTRKKQPKWHLYFSPQ